MSVYRQTVGSAAVLDIVGWISLCHGRMGSPFGACCRQLPCSLELICTLYTLTLCVCISPLCICVVCIVCPRAPCWAISNEL